MLRILVLHLPEKSAKMLKNYIAYWLEGYCHSDPHPIR